MKKWICIFCAMLLVVFSAACTAKNADNASSSDMQSSEQSAPAEQSATSGQLTMEGYRVLQSGFIYQFQQVLEQLQANLSSYSGGEDWWNSFQTLCDQANQLWIDFQANMTNVPEACTSDYQALSAAIEGYRQAMDAAKQAKDLTGSQQQQKLAEASTFLIEANAQWQKLSNG